MCTGCDVHYYVLCDHVQYSPSPRHCDYVIHTHAYTHTHAHTHTHMKVCIHTFIHKFGGQNI